MIKDRSSYTQQERDFIEWAKDPQGGGYVAPVIMGEHRPGEWAACYGFIYTCAIVTGRVNDRTGYDQRWCYSTPNDALVALVRWAVNSFEGEPEGWHRHPASGRRRPDGDAEQEYIRA